MPTIQQVVLLALCSLSQAKPHKAFHWCYNDKTCGPQEWEKHFEGCGGDNQSPIDIVPDLATTQSIEPFQFLRFDETENVKFILKNTGHSIQVDVQQKESPHSPQSAYQMTGAGLPGPDPYQLAQFHFHFGRDSQGSEHTVDGNHFPVEMHLVSWNTKYSNISEAVQQPDGLAVIGVFFKFHSEWSCPLADISAHLHFVQEAGNTKAIPMFPIRDLLPSNVDEFYRYSGSLTTPGCNEVVTWTIMREPTYIRHSEMRHFLRKAKNVVDNYRPTQDLKGRSVYKNF